jgi:diacylglycerol kinase (ATP)
MDAPNPANETQYRHLQKKSALPGKGGLTRIGRAFLNTLGGFREGLATEAAIKQEAVLLFLALPVSFFVASDLWTWVVLVGSLLFVLAVEFLNTAIERLCNHLHPEKHEAIKVTKDLASAGVFCVIVLAGLTWTVAVIDRFFL